MVISVSSCFQIYSDIYNGTLQITQAAIMSEREFVLRSISGVFILEKIHRCTDIRWFPYNVTIALLAANNSSCMENASLISILLYTLGFWKIHNILFSSHGQRTVLSTTGPVSVFVDETIFYNGHELE